VLRRWQLGSGLFGTQLSITDQAPVAGLYLRYLALAISSRASSTILGTCTGRERPPAIRLPNMRLKLPGAHK